MVQSSLSEPARIPAKAFRRRAPGFSLLEVLVSIVVLSFGVLGVVGLQAAALQANKEARFQAAGVRLARELSDLMRGNYASAGAPGNPYLATVSSAIPFNPPPQDCYLVTCTSPDNIAKFQKYEWASRLSDELPGATSAVCFDTSPYDSSGKPQWSCTGTGTVAYIKIGWDRQSTNRNATTPDAGSSAPTVVMPVIPN